jgi:hypothetical protein
MNLSRKPALHWLLKVMGMLVMMLVLTGVFAWYFVGPVPFDLDRLWAFCAGR